MSIDVNCLPHMESHLHGISYGEWRYGHIVITNTKYWYHINVVLAVPHSVSIQTSNIALHGNVFDMYKLVPYQYLNLNPFEKLQCKLAILTNK